MTEGPKAPTERPDLAAAARKPEDATDPGGYGEKQGQGDKAAG